MISALMRHSAASTSTSHHLAIRNSTGRTKTSGANETVRLVPRLNPPDLKVVDEVSDPEREVSLSDARRYNARLELGDTMTQGPTGIMIGTANVRIVKESFPIWEAVPMSFGKMRTLYLAV